MSRLHESRPDSGGSLLFNWLVLAPAAVIALFAGGTGIVFAWGGLAHLVSGPRLAPGGETQLTSLPDTNQFSKATASSPTTPLPLDTGVTDDKAALIAEGQKLYATTCIACHQPSGQGVPNAFPPLAGSDWVCQEDTDCAIAVVLGGLQGPIQINGQPFNTPMAMPPQGGMLDDRKVAAILTFVRNSWGNEGPAVPVNRVKELRRKFQSRSALWTQEEIHAAIHARPDSPAASPGHASQAPRP